MLIGRQSVTSLYKGAVAFGTAPIAKIQCGSRWKRSTYSKDPAVSHSERTRMSTFCASGSSSQDLWLRQNMGSRGRPSLATVNVPSRIASSSAEMDPKYRCQNGLACCSESLARTILNIFTRRSFSPVAGGGPCNGSASKPNHISIKCRPGRNRTLGHDCAKRKDIIRSASKLITTAPKS